VGFCPAIRLISFSGVLAGRISLSWVIAGNSFFSREIRVEGLKVRPSWSAIAQLILRYRPAVVRAR